MKFSVLTLVMFFSEFTAKFTLALKIHGSRPSYATLGYFHSILGQFFPKLGHFYHFWVTSVSYKVAKTLVINVHK